MARPHRPRHGSLAFRPRKRASKLTPRVGSWAKNDESKLLGFLGYKAGMTHVAMVDDSNRPTKGQEVSVSATVVEVPPMVVFGIRGYVIDDISRTLKTLSDAYTTDENVLKSLNLVKNEGLKVLEEKTAELADVHILAVAQPNKAGFGKKHPDFTEIALGGKDSKSKLDFAKTLLGKEVNAKDVFVDGEYVDAVSITVGKGWQGVVKRFGVAVQRRKATNKRRHLGTLGPWHPARVMFTTPMAGQMGFHRRTSINNRILTMRDNPAEVNPVSGFPQYGVVKNPCLIIKGSLGGPKKRAIFLRKAVRKAPGKKPEIKYISTKSQLG